MNSERLQKSNSPSKKKSKSDSAHKFIKIDEEKSRHSIKNFESLFDENPSREEQSPLEIDPFDSFLEPSEPSSDYQDTKITPLSELFPRFSENEGRTGRMRKILIKIFIFGLLSTILLLYLNSLLSRRGVWSGRGKGSGGK